MKKTIYRITLLVFITLLSFTESKAQTITGPPAVTNQTNTYTANGFGTGTYYYWKVFMGTFPSNGQDYLRATGGGRHVVSVKWDSNCPDLRQATILLAATNRYFNSFEEARHHIITTGNGVYLPVSFENSAPCTDPCPEIRAEINAIINDNTLDLTTQAYQISQIITAAQNAGNGYCIPNVRICVD